MPMRWRGGSLPSSESTLRSRATSVSDSSRSRARKTVSLSRPGVISRGGESWSPSFPFTTENRRESSLSSSFDGVATTIVEIDGRGREEIEIREREGLGAENESALEKKRLLRKREPRRGGVRESECCECRAVLLDGGAKEPGLGRELQRAFVVGRVELFEGPREETVEPALRALEGGAREDRVDQIEHAARESPSKLKGRRYARVLNLGKGALEKRLAKEGVDELELRRGSRGQERKERRGRRAHRKERGGGPPQERVFELPPEKMRRRRGREDDQRAGKGERILLEEFSEVSGSERSDAAKTAAENQLPARHFSIAILSVR